MKYFDTINQKWLVIKGGLLLKIKKLPIHLYFIVTMYL